MLPFVDMIRSESGQPILAGVIDQEQLYLCDPDNVKLAGPALVSSLRDFPEAPPGVIDLSATLNDWEGDFAKAKRTPEPDLEHAERRLKGFLRAIKDARIDLTNVTPRASLFAPRVLQDYFRGRHQLAQKMLAPVEVSSDGYQLLRAIIEMERAGIFVDQIKARDISMTGLDFERNFARSILGSTDDDGFAHFRVTPFGSKTERFRSLSHFNPMSIPKGECRKVVVPREVEGKIVSLDFNAIDFRSIVTAVDDGALNYIYKSSDDFHLTTCSAVFGEKFDPNGPTAPIIRNLVKQVVYVYLYGGSTQTIMGKTGASRSTVENVMKRLDVLFCPVNDFRKELFKQAHEKGVIDVPGGTPVVVPRDTHEGHILGLLAQTFSSRVFNGAFVRVQKRAREFGAKVIFTVFDEIILDFPPMSDELLVERLEDLDRLASTSELGSFKVKAKIGENYHDATS